MRGCKLLYFVKSKSGTKCKNFAVLLCQCIHSFTFPEMAGRGGYSPPSHPPKSATDFQYFKLCNFVVKFV